MLTLSDEELVRRCKIELPDDTRSFELLVKRHSAKIYSFTYRIMGNREEAEDITQEVFLKIFNNLKKFEQQASFLSWAYRIATNSALDALAKLKRRPNYKPQSSMAKGKEEEEEQWYSFQTAVSADPEQIISRSQLRDCIAEVFTNLERDQASVLIMRDVDNLGYQEIAAASNVGLSAIKMRIYRARLAFQELFQKLCDPDFGVNISGSADNPKLARTLAKERSNLISSYKRGKA